MHKPPCRAHWIYGTHFAVKKKCNLSHRHQSTILERLVCPDANGSKCSRTSVPTWSGGAPQHELARICWHPWSESLQSGLGDFSKIWCARIALRLACKNESMVLNKYTIVFGMTWLSHECKGHIGQGSIAKEHWNIGWIGRFSAENAAGRSFSSINFSGPIPEQCEDTVHGRRRAEACQILVLAYFSKLDFWWGRLGSEIKTFQLQLSYEYLWVMPKIFTVSQCPCLCKECTDKFPSSAWSPSNPNRSTNADTVTWFHAKVSMKSSTWLWVSPRPGRWPAPDFDMWWTKVSIVLEPRILTCILIQEVYWLSNLFYNSTVIC